ncbi:MAG: hypothetical protein AB1384_13520 [Actinomycetota bacterium]
MDEKSEAVWQAMRAAYKAGLTDEILGVAGALMPPGMDQIEMLGDAEDHLMRADLTALAGMLDDMLIPLARALAGQEAVEAMKNLLLTAKPLVEGIVVVSGGDATVIRDRLLEMRASLLALRPILRAATPGVLKAASPHVEEFLRNKAGPAVGGMINAQLAGLERLNETSPRAIPAFLEGISATVDIAAMKKAASVLFPVLLAHRPKLFKWLVQEILIRMRQYLGAIKGGRGQ